MGKSKRIEPIANLAKNSERDAAKALGDALRQLNEQLEQLDNLNNYKLDYNQRLSSSGSKGMNVQTMNEYREFIAKLTLAIEQQQQVIEQAKQVLEEKKRFWFARRGRYKALDSVLDRYIQNEQKQLDKKDQRELDDRNSRPK